MKFSLRYGRAPPKVGAGPPPKLKVNGALPAAAPLNTKAGVLAEGAPAGAAAACDAKSPPGAALAGPDACDCCTAAVKEKGGEAAAGEAKSTGAGSAARLAGATGADALPKSNIGADDAGGAGAWFANAATGAPPWPECACKKAACGGADAAGAGGSAACGAAE